MNNNIIITFEDGTKKEYPKGIKVKEIIKQEKERFPYEVILACSKNKKINMEEELHKNTFLKMYDITTMVGSYIYEKGITFLFETAALEIIGKDTKIKVMHPIDKGIYFKIDKRITEEQIEQIKSLMKEKVKQDIPFERIETTRIEASHVESSEVTPNHNKNPHLSITIQPY